MNASAYQFRLGGFQCAAVADGSFVYGPPMFPPPAQFLFANAPAEDIVQILGRYDLRPDQWGEWTSSYTCLLIDTGDKRVLVDTGAGPLGPETGRLIESLGSVGVLPDDIDMIIHTHGHPDHLGGNAAADGSILYPKARWAMSGTEWRFWMEGQAEAVLPEEVGHILLGFAQRNLGPLRERMDLIEGEQEVVPGITLLPTPGHTPGHVSLRLSSGGEEMLVLSDLVLHPIHLEHPEWVAGVDMLPDQLVRSRRSLLAKAAEEQTLVMGFHFAFPGLGRVAERGDGWEWRLEN